MPTKIQGGLGIDKVQDGTVGMSDVDTELYGKITALTTINLGEAKTASGTFVDFVGIPEGVKRITVMFDGVSTTGTSPIQMQFGDSGGFETSGYKCSCSTQSGSTVTAFTTGFGLTTSLTATQTYNGDYQVTSFGNLSWAGNGCFEVDGALRQGAGSKTLSGPLDRIRITTVNGTDQFDAGIINISWEF